MKKFVSLLLAVVLAMTVCVSALAAPNGFVESPSNQKGPEIIEGGGIVITPFGDRDELPDDLREALEDAYNSILNADNLGDLVEALEEIAKTIGVPVENFSVSELFNISMEDGKTNPDGKFEITLDAPSLKDFVGLIKFENGKWELIEDAEIIDGKLVFAPGKLPSPFAIVVNTKGSGDSDADSAVPPTGESNMVVVATVVGVASLAALFFVFKKREA